MDECEAAAAYAAKFNAYHLAKPRAKTLAADVSAEHCHHCDAPIPEARRRAMPGCVLCVSCQQEEERF